MSTLIPTYSRAPLRCSASACAAWSTGPPSPGLRAGTPSSPCLAVRWCRSRYTTTSRTSRRREKGLSWLRLWSQLNGTSGSPRARTPEEFGDEGTADYLSVNAEDLFWRGERFAVVMYGRASRWLPCFPKRSNSADHTKEAFRSFIGRKLVKSFYTDCAPELRATDVSSAGSSIPRSLADLSPTL